MELTFPPASTLDPQPPEASGSSYPSCPLSEAEAPDPVSPPRAVAPPLGEEEVPAVESHARVERVHVAQVQDPLLLLVHAAAAGPLQPLLPFA